MRTYCSVLKEKILVPQGLGRERDFNELLLMKAYAVLIQLAYNVHFYPALYFASD